MKIIISNSFSLNMIETPNTIKVEEISAEETKKILSNTNWKSVVGHESTAQILTQILGLPVPMNRQAIKLSKEDILVVFQLLERLPEGKVLSEEELKTIPYKFLKISISE
jgi:hypothetical protein